MSRRTSGAPLRAHAIHLTVPRTARVVLIGEPTPEVRQVWIACHGYGQLATEFAHGLAALAADDRLVVVPEALSRFYLKDEGGVHGPEHPVGATWMTREERLHEIDDYCAYLDVVYDHVFSQLDRGAVDVRTLGFSQGSATVARWAARTSRSLDQIVLWGAGLPAELAPRRGLFGKAALTLVYGERDVYAAEHIGTRLVPELERAGVQHGLERFQGGHRLDDATLLRLAG